MLHRVGDFEEWQLAEAAKEYISLYAKPGNKVCFVPYRDVPSNSIKYVKFVFEEAIGWVYVDNSQHS